MSQQMLINLPVNSCYEQCKQ